MEAFRSHPRIGESAIGESGIGESGISESRTGESKALEQAPVQSSAWSKQEQQNVATAGDAVKIELAQANQEYERRFNRTFIVCATGKSAPEILEILRHRLRNDEKTEVREAAEQQRLITRIRLNKWLSQ